MSSLHLNPIPCLRCAVPLLEFVCTLCCPSFSSILFAAHSPEAWNSNLYAARRGLPLSGESARGREGGGALANTQFAARLPAQLFPNFYMKQLFFIRKLFPFAICPLLGIALPVSRHQQNVCTILGCFYSGSNSFASMMNEDTSTKSQKTISAQEIVFCWCVCDMPASPALLSGRLLI